MDAIFENGVFKPLRKIKFYRLYQLCTDKSI
ncbi:MAG: DUF104 domain-containing protein [Candidatus Brocadia sp.]|nr:antitoxin family protein [Candidatus Brocadia sp.]MDG6027400.1 DUF104 domain-containing protein [Candidatus Brocadia sp.]